MNKIRSWDGVVDCFKRRLTKWKAKALSFGGRIVLIKAVLDSLPIYFFSLFKVPKGVLEKLEAIRRRFFWSGDEDKAKTSWIAWERVIGPVDKGGLGLGSLKQMNESLMVKWWWRFKVEKGALWQKVVAAIHYNPNAWTYLPVKAGVASTWNSINKAEKDLLDQNVDVKSIIKGKIGNGLDVRFWLDWWVDECSLMFKFPALFALEANKNVTVAERRSAWEWKRVSNGVIEVNELQHLEELVHDVVLNGSKDEWIWSESSLGVFSVKECRKLLVRNAVPFYPFEWVKGAPKKVSIFGWRAIQDRLPTLMGLKKRKIIHGSTMCKICGEGDENADHLLTSCYVASVIWNKVSTWTNIPPIFAFSVKDLLELHSNIKLSKEKKQAVRLIILAMCWAIWRARNDLIFSGQRCNPVGIFLEAQVMAFSWVKHKTKQSGWTWENWVAFNPPIT